MVRLQTSSLSIVKLLKNNLHSNMVRLQTNKNRMTLLNLNTFTFQYG